MSNIIIYWIFKEWIQDVITISHGWNGILKEKICPQETYAYQKKSGLTAYDTVVHPRSWAGKKIKPDYFKNSIFLVLEKIFPVFKR